MRQSFGLTKYAATPCLSLLVAGPAFAHPGHGGIGLIAGFMHPFTGFDHLLAMVMVGLWSALAFPQRWWVCPTVFVSFMVAGFAWGASGGALPGAETLILASLVVLGAGLMIDARPPLTPVAAVIGMFAVAHGFAHGSEMPAGNKALEFAAGFVTATIALHGAGVTAARLIVRFDWRPLARALGAVATLYVAASL